MTGVHKAEPADPDAAVTSCVVCKGLVRTVPGGHGPTWVHDATGTVVGSGSKDQFDHLCIGDACTDPKHRRD